MVRRMRAFLVALSCVALISACTGSNTADPVADSLMSDAVVIRADEIFTEDLRDVMALDDSDTVFSVPIGGYQLIIRIRPGTSPNLYATSCEVLTTVDLPDGWEGSCLERTVNQQRVRGVFEYGEVAE